MWGYDIKKRQDWVSGGREGGGGAFRIALRSILRQRGKNFPLGKTRGAGRLRGRIFFYMCLQLTFGAMQGGVSRYVRGVSASFPVFGLRKIRGRSAVADKLGRFDARGNAGD